MRRDSKIVTSMQDTSRDTLATFPSSTRRCLALLLHTSLLKSLESTRPRLATALKRKDTKMLVMTSSMISRTLRLPECKEGTTGRGNNSDEIEPLNWVCDMGFCAHVRPHCLHLHLHQTVKK
uniref:Uncharacterized protein n=1 Tax=Cacopsylla melanoneura TaxID=428564 RepID=A0A8D8WXF9_9HEMI